MKPAPSPGQDDYQHDGSHLDVDDGFWERAAARDVTALGHLTFFDAVGDRCLGFQFLDQPLRVDLERRCLMRRVEGRWEAYRDRLLELATVLYLANVKELLPLDRDIVGISDLKESHFFVGPHELMLDGLIDRFGSDPAGFQRAALACGGKPVEMADSACRLTPFPRVPLYYLLWQGDAEFAPRLRVLVDRPIETVLAADAIWALINRVSEALASA
jgi:hypothetical protein